jgi:hypothetical protein
VGWGFELLRQDSDGKRMELDVIEQGDKLIPVWRWNGWLRR